MYVSITFGEEMNRVWNFLKVLCHTNLWNITILSDLLLPVLLCLQQISWSCHENSFSHYLQTCLRDTMGVMLANNKMIIYPGGVTSVHLDISLSQTQFVQLWLHQSHQWRQHGELSLSETEGLRCKGLKSSNFTEDADRRVMNTEMRSVRAFLHTEIRNKKWSGGLFLTWEPELVSNTACNNSYYSNNDALQILPTVSSAYKLILLLCINLQ